MKTNVKVWMNLLATALLLSGIAIGCSDDNEEATTVAIKDSDGNAYTSVTIGTQVWLKENLKTTKYNDGTSIPFIINNGEWASLTTPGFSWYDNDEAAYKNTYGALYNWYAVTTGKLCPSGWHVPSQAEWNTMITALGGQDEAGGKLKEAGTAHWISPNTGATNSSGFTALPGGSRQIILGNFAGMQYGGVWWASTDITINEEMAWNYILYYDGPGIGMAGFSKVSGYSVRCIKN